MCADCCCSTAISAGPAHRRGFKPSSAWLDLPISRYSYPGWEEEEVVEEEAGERRPSAQLRMNTLIDNYSSDSGCLQTVYGTRFQIPPFSFSLSSCMRVRASPGSVRACAPLQRQMDERSIRWSLSALKLRPRTPERLWCVQTTKAYRFFRPQPPLCLYQTDCFYPRLTETAGHLRLYRNVIK